MADLSVLRTAKLAMAEELIEQEDFDVIKRAFLKAQQIKAGMDAGFLREEDFIQARDAFLHALDFKVAKQSSYDHGAPSPASVPSAAFGMRAPSAAAATVQQAPHAPAPIQVAKPVAHVAPAPVASSVPVPPPAASLSQLQPAVAVASASRAPSAPASNGGSVGLAQLNDLPRIGRAGIAAGKKSMSGISVNDQCINVFNHIKTKSTFKWVVYKIDDAGSDVVPEAVGPSDSSYGEFIASLPAVQCRYGVFDYAITNADTQQTINKLVFVNWAPDASSIRTKMMYASTKDFFKGFLDGVSAELQATDVQELQESEMMEKVYHNLTRK